MTMASERPLDAKAQISQVTSLNWCRECNGAIIQIDHELVCSECGLIVESVHFLGSQRLYERDESFDFNNWGHPFLSWMNISDQRLAKGLNNNRALTLLDNFEVSLVKYEQIALYKKYYRRFIPGGLIYATLNEVCIPNHIYLPSRPTLLQTLQDYRLCICRREICDLEYLLNLRSESPQTRLDYHLNRYFNQYPDIQMFQLCQQQKTKLDNVSGRSPRVLAAALIYYCGRQNSSPLSQEWVASFFNTTGESIRKMKKYW